MSPDIERVKEEIGYGQNSGHGHVWERPDGVRARCGGPGLCAECSRVQALLNNADNGGKPGKWSAHADQNATPENPFYFKFRQDDGAKTLHFGITCSEGWRQSIVCTGMYEWCADWLVEQLQGKPFAKPRS